MSAQEPQQADDAVDVDAPEPPVDLMEALQESVAPVVAPPLEDAVEAAQIEARATIHLPGLPCGKTTFVDPSSRYIKDCLAAGYLVPVVSAD